MTVNNLRDLVGGLMVAAIGLAFLYGALNMRIGSAMQMGPGYFPMLVGGIVTFFGVVIAGMALTTSAVAKQIEWRPMLAVLSAIAAFALVLAQLGLIPAMILGVLLASAGDTTSKFREAAIVALLAAVLAWLVFRVGLGLQMPAFRFPSWLG